MYRKCFSFLLIVIALFFLLSRDVSALEIQYKPVGSFDGVGITVEKAVVGYSVTGVFRSSPSRGKIKPGDLIMSINGKPVRNLGAGQFYKLVRQPAGTEIKMVVSRMGTMLKFVLKTAEVKIMGKTIPKTKMPVGKVLEFETGFRILSNLSKVNRLKVGDVFFLMKGDRHVGYARVNRVRRNSSILSVLKISERPKEFSGSKYRLVYFAYMPSIHISGKRRNTAKKTGPKGRPIIKVESYELYIMYGRLTSKVKFRNIGTGTADSFIVTCYFVGDGRTNLGQGTQSFRRIPPGGRVVGIFRSNVRINLNKNYVDFSRDGRKASIHQGPSRSSSVQYKVECKFKSE